MLSFKRTIFQNLYNSQIVTLLKRDILKIIKLVILFIRTEKMKRPSPQTQVDAWPWMVQKSYEQGVLQRFMENE